MLHGYRKVLLYFLRPNCCMEIKLNMMVKYLSVEMKHVDWSSLFSTEESYHGNYNTIKAMREGYVLTLRLAHIIHSVQFTELNFRKNEKFMPGRFVTY